MAGPISTFQEAMNAGETIDWMAAGACVGDADGMWEPEANDLCNPTPAIRHAVQVCDRCPVQETCRDFADRTKQAFGIWGGVWRDLTLARNRRRDLRAVA